MEGKGWKHRKGPPHTPSPTYSILAACVTEASLLVSHCPPLSLLMSLGWGLMVRHTTSGKPGGRRRKRGRALNARMAPAVPHPPTPVPPLLSPPTPPAPCLLTTFTLHYSERPLGPSRR